MSDPKLIPVDATGGERVKQAYHETVNLLERLFGEHEGSLEINSYLATGVMLGLADVAWQLAPADASTPDQIRAALHTALDLAVDSIAQLRALETQEPAGNA